MIRTAFLAVALLASPAIAAPDKALLAAARGEAPKVAGTLEQLVTIETGTGDAEGMAAMGKYLEARFVALGATVERVKPLPGTAGDIIVARKVGTGHGNLLLIAHMDTVYQRGALARAPFRIDGDRAYGPGVADDKSGIAVILHTLPLLKSRDFKTLTIAVNTDEEAGSVGTGPIITEIARGKDLVLSFEPSGRPEMLIRGTWATNTVTVTIKGKASHAGVAPEQGVNALVEAANIMLKTRDLDLGPGKRRFNWTIISQQRGVRNIIPDNAVLVGDLRTESLAETDAFRVELTNRLATPSLPGAEVKIVVKPNRPAFTASPANIKLIERARDIYVEAGGTIGIGDRWGGTDAGYASISGVPVIESLGLPGYGYHSGDAEFVYLDAVPQRLYLAAALIREHGR